MTSAVVGLFLILNQRDAWNGQGGRKEGKNEPCYTPSVGEGGRGLSQQLNNMFLLLRRNPLLFCC